MIDLSSGPVLVTGASSGIGAALVRRLRERGRHVVAVARRQERLDDLARETGCDTRAADLTDLDAIEALVGDVAPAVVVNNAGSGQGYEGLENASGAQIAAAVTLNVMAPLHVMRAAAPLMRRAGGGHIVNIGSIAGLHPINNALYASTKAAVHAMTQNMRIELKGSGIRVTEVAPGRTESEFYDASGLPPEAVRRFKELPIRVLEPDDVAAAVIYAVEAPPHVNVSLLELMPTEQAVGGAVIEPYGGAGA